MSNLKFFNKKVSEEKITYGNKIVDGIVNVAISEIPYVELFQPNYISKSNKRIKSIKVSYDKGVVSVDVIVKVHYTQSVTEMAFMIQEAIKHSVESMTEYKVNNVNVIVNGVLFDDVIIEKTEEAEQKHDQHTGKEEIIEKQV